MPRSKAEGMGRRGVKTRCRGSWRHQHGGLQIYDAADVGLCPRVTGIETIPLTITKCCEHIVRTYIRISFCTYVHARVITACVHACAGSSTCMYPITNVRTYVCQYIPAYKCAGLPQVFSFRPPRYHTLAFKLLQAGANAHLVRRSYFNVEKQRLIPSRTSSPHRFCNGGPLTEPTKQRATVLPRFFA